MANLGDIVIGLRMDHKGFSAGAKSAQKDVSSIGSIAAGVASGLAAFTAAMEVGSRVAGGIRWGAEMAIQAEQAQVAFTTMLKSPERAKALLKDLSDFAVSTPYETPEVTAAAKQLLAYGTSADNIIPQLRMLGDVASGVGIPLGDLAYLFGTAQVQGRLFAKDINQFTGRGIPIIDALAKSMGVAKGEVMGLVEEGKVTATEMTAAFQLMTKEGGQFSGMMETQSQTVSGLWSTLKDNIGLTMRDIAQALFDGFDLKSVMKNSIAAMESFRANFTTLWLPMIKELGESLRSAFDWAVSLGEIVVRVIPGGGAWLDDVKERIAGNRKASRDREFSATAREWMKKQNQTPFPNLPANQTPLGDLNFGPLAAEVKVKDGKKKSPEDRAREQAADEFAARFAGLDQNDPANAEKYMMLVNEREARTKSLTTKNWKDESNKMRNAPAKEAGAIEAGSREFWSALAAGGRGTPGQQQTQLMQQMLKVLMDERKDAQQERRDMKRRKVFEVQRFE